jgi:hypothetical protein
VQGQVGDAEQAGDAGQSVHGTLHLHFEEEVQRPFKRDEPVRVLVRVG